MEEEREINNNSEVNRVVPVVSEAVEVTVGLENVVTDNGTGGTGGGGLDVSVLGDAPAKRKRGRPRKHEESLPSDFLVVPEYSSAPPQKRGRGRPKGSGKWQRANSLGVHSAQIGTAGSNFAASIINLQRGEDIYQTMRLYSQRTLDSLCILSACGSVSSAVLHHDGLQGGNATYEGYFDIVTLTGTHAYTEQGLRHGKNCTMSVHLVNSSGQFLGGAVVGPLIAASPIQVNIKCDFVVHDFPQNRTAELLVLGTFREQIMMRHRVERPKPKKPVVAAVPLQAINGSTLPVPGGNGVAAVPPVPAPLGEESGKLIDSPDVIAASQQHAPPFDESDEAMNGPDVNPALNQQAPPADDVYRDEMGPHSIPASPQTADWNSLQPSVIKSGRVVSDPDVGAAGQ